MISHFVNKIIQSSRRYDTKKVKKYEKWIEHHLAKKYVLNYTTRAKNVFYLWKFTDTGDIPGKQSGGDP